MDYIELTYWQVAAAAALVLLLAAVSFVLQLGLGWRLLLAAVRTVLQLLLVGLVLEGVFGLRHWYLVAALMAVMTAIAGGAAVRRTDRRYPGVWLAAMAAMFSSSWIVTAFAVFVVLREVDPWYEPQYTIPLLGMILGNTLNGISLGLGRVGDELLARRGEVEMLLTLGATRWEAARDCVRQAIRTGMVPIINSMMVVGIVSLPGMMTGQLLAGTPPMEAVKYQIVIMFLIAAATTLGTVGVVLMSYRRLFNARHQFLYGRLSKAK